MEHLLEPTQTKLPVQEMIHSPPPPSSSSSSIPSVIEIPPNANYNADISIVSASSGYPDHAASLRHQQSPTLVLPPSVECHDGCVTFRDHRVQYYSPHNEPKQQHYNNNNNMHGMSFITEALTYTNDEHLVKAEQEEDYFFYRDVEHDNNIHHESLVPYPSSSSHPQLTNNGSVGEEEKEQVTDAPLSLPYCSENENCLTLSNNPIPLTQTQEQSQHPYPDDPPVEENRLVVISQQCHKHHTALEPEEYVYPREFTSITIKKLNNNNNITNNNININYKKSSLEQHSNIHKSMTTLTKTSKSSSISSHECYNGYQHCFVTVLTEHRFLMLYTFLFRQSSQQRLRKNKIVILFATIESLMYYKALLHRLKFHVRSIHTGMEREDVAEEIHMFSEEVDNNDDDDDSEDHTRILCMLNFQGHTTTTTEDTSTTTIPSTANWIVQFEPCTNPSEYIYQVGRISHDSVSSARNNNSSRNSRQRRASYGSSFQRTHHPHDDDNDDDERIILSPPPPRALLFLTPNEYGFHRYFKAAQVKTYEYEIPHLRNVQNRLMKLLRSEENLPLRQLGVKACRSYLSAYAQHEFGDIYNVDELDVDKVALSFGFNELPSNELLGSKSNCSGSGGGDDYDDDDDERMVSKVENNVRRRKSSSSSTSWRPKSVMKARSSCSSGSTSWMTGEKTWRHADVHAEKMRVNGIDSKKNIPSFKPKIVLTR